MTNPINDTHSSSNMSNDPLPELNKNVIAFRSGMMFLKGTEDHPQLAATIQAELMNLGYMLDETALQNLRSAPEEEAITFYNEVITWIRAMMGDGHYCPMYAGFPQDVMALSDYELFSLALIHYQSDGQFVVNAFTEKRPQAFEHGSYTMIRPGTEEEFSGMIRNILSVEQSIAPLDVKTLRWFFQHYPADVIQTYLPSRIPFKENLCLLVSDLKIVPKTMTTTDALRVIVARSGGDISLPAKADKIRKFSRLERRELLALLESINLCVEEMVLKRNRWLRVGEILHPGEYAKRFPKVFAAFQRLRNEKVQTWYSKYHSLTSLADRLAMLSQRPGEFARRLDSLLRAGCPRYIRLRQLNQDVCRSRRTRSIRLMNKLRKKSVTEAIHQAAESLAKDNDDTSVLRRWPELAQEWLAARLREARLDPYTQWKTLEEEMAPAVRAELDNRPQEEVDLILASFEQIVTSISPKVLYELYAHFEDRCQDQKMRTIFIKGQRTLTHLMPLSALESETVNRIQAIIVESLKSRYRTLPPLGRCYIDSKLRNIPLPTNMRTISDSAKTVVRGIRVPLDNPKAKVVRFYVHWKDPLGTIDLDLSATYIGSKAIDTISWNNGYVGINSYGEEVMGKAYGVHSGDIRHRVGNCAEYIDIVLEEARKRFDYVVVDVRNFDGESVGSVAPVFGYMEREHPESNLIWVPHTVKNSFLLTSPCVTTLVVAFDLHKMEYVVLDLDSNGIPIATDDREAIRNALEKYVSPPKITVYDLVQWHLDARGGEVSQKENAENSFDYLDFSNDYVNILNMMFPCECSG